MIMISQCSTAILLLIEELHPLRSELLVAVAVLDKELTLQKCKAIGMAARKRQRFWTTIH